MKEVFIISAEKSDKSILFNEVAMEILENALQRDGLEYITGAGTDALDMPEELVLIISYTDPVVSSGYAAFFEMVDYFNDLRQIFDQDYFLYVDSNGEVFKFDDSASACGFPASEGVMVEVKSARGPHTTVLGRTYQIQQLPTEEAPEFNKLEEDAHKARTLNLWG
jgi:hypothetical protein